MPPLHQAIMKMDLKTIMVLLNFGSDVNQLDLKSKACALYAALKIGCNNRIIDVILEYKPYLNY